MIKKMIVCVLALMLVIQTLSMSVWMGEVHAAPSGGGSGTSVDPYIILTAQDLSDIRNDLSAHYKLGADIDLSGYDFDGIGPDTGGWMPIGAIDDTTSNPFTGTLDGNGYAIRNLTINRPSMSFVGLFGRISTNANLINMRLIDINVTGSTIVGGLVGNQISGTIENSYATGSVSAPNSNGGGLVGVNANGTIQNSYAVVNVSGWGRLGGLVSTNAGTIQNSYAAGNVNGDNEIGGLAGYILASGTIGNSYAVGKVTGNLSVGGLIGRNDSSSLASSYWNMDTSGRSNSAGGTGITTEDMKDANIFTGWNTAVWGFRAGETYPYLRAFNMGIGVDPLAATMYNLHPGQDALSVTGNVFHDASGEQITVKYVIRDSSNVTVTEATYMTSDGNSALSINRRFSLAGWSNDDYTLTITAADTHNTVVGAMLAFKVDDSTPQPPSVGFGPNGNETWAQSASTSVTVSDSGGGVDASSLQYAWSADSATPGPGSVWTSFTSGDMLSKNGVDGDWYLHIRAKDNANIAANVVSNRFRLDTSSAILGGLTLSTVSLNAAFAGSTYNYTAAVANGVSTISVTPTAADATDTVTVSVNGGTPQPVVSGTASGQLALNTGANTITVEVAALNGLQTTYTVTVTRAAPSSNPASTDEPDIASGPELIVEPSGGVRLIIDPSMIEKVTGPDGTVIETVNLDEKTLNQALALLQDTENPILTIEVNDTERVFQVQLPAAWIALAAKSVPNAVIDVKLNGSSFQLIISVLDLEDVAARLGVELKDLKVNVIMERVEGQVKDELDQIASAQGGKVIGSAVDYKVTVTAANGQSAEVRDFGGTYVARAIVLDADKANKSLTAVLYDPVAHTISFVPSVLAVRADGKQEIAMSVPHNSIYAIMETGGRTFADLSGHWAKADVELLASKLIVQGVTDSRFAPDADITRAEFTALLVRALGLSVNPNAANTRFADVAASAWYTPAVESAVKAGLVNGMAPERFAPDERITREQMAVMIARALAVAGKPSDAADPESPGLSKFADRASISAWAQASVAQAVAAGIIAGMPDGTFAPSEYANRAQAAVMLKWFLQHVRFVD